MVAFPWCWCFANDMRSLYPINLNHGFLPGEMPSWPNRRASSYHVLRRRWIDFRPLCQLSWNLQSLLAFNPRLVSKWAWPWLAKKNKNHVSIKRKKKNQREYIGLEQLNTCIRYVIEPDTGIFFSRQGRCKQCLLSFFAMEITWQKKGSPSLSRIVYLIVVVFYGREANVIFLTKALSR